MLCPHLIKMQQVLHRLLWMGAVLCAIVVLTGLIALAGRSDAAGVGSRPGASVICLYAPDGGG
jgi:hypothetical protein